MAANASFFNSSQDDHACSGSIVSVLYYSLNCVFVLPLSLLVLCLGFRRWWRQRSVPISHCDFLTYNLAIMELIGVSGCLIALYSRIKSVYMQVGLWIFVFPWPGQMMFPVFTCVDRYLAVVHPITYMRLKHGGGMRIRLTSAGFIWLMCFSMAGFIFLMQQNPQNQYISDIFQMILFPCLLIIMAFCCVSVLCVLTGPRPGEGPRDRLTADKSKRKAFVIIFIIMVVLCLRLGGSLFSNVLQIFNRENNINMCKMESVISLWFNLPSSLVLPLLYLHRAMKIPGCKHNPASG